MTFKISLVQANWCLMGTGHVDSYTILKTEKVREIGRGAFVSVLLACHNREGVDVRQCAYLKIL